MQMLTDKFEVGEVVNSDGNIGCGINFEVTELLEDCGLRIKLTEVDEIWATQGVAVGQEYILDHQNNESKEWWIFRNSTLPWFILSINNGEKRFIYYR